MAQANLFTPLTPEGAALSNLVSSLYAPDASVKREEREALAEERRASAALKKAQIQNFADKKAAEDAKRKDEANIISRLAGALVPGQGDAIASYRNAGGVQPNTLPALDDDGIEVGQPPTIPMNRPAGYSPEIEKRLTNDLYNQILQGSLSGTTNLEQFAKGGVAFQERDVIGQALSGVRPKEDAYIVQGKPAFDFNAQVPIGNLATGAADSTNPFSVASIGATNAKAAADTAHAGLYRAQAGRAGRDDAPLVQVRDPSSPTGFKWSTRGSAVGQPSPLAGATNVKDALVPTTPNVTEGQRVINDSADTRALISEARTLAADPRNFGASGILRATVQDMIQQGDALARTLGSRAAEVQQDVMSLGSDVGLENFDTSIPQLDLMTNLLAFRLAKMNDPGGRVTDQDFRIAKSKITGGSMLGNQADFLARLDLFERTLAGNVKRKEEFLGGRGQRGAITPAPSGAAPKVIQYDAQGNRLN